MASDSCEEDLNAYKTVETELWNRKLFVIIRDGRESQYDRIRKLENCLAEGADINFQNSKGKTIMHIAVEKQLNEIVQYLLDSGARINIKNTHGETPVDITKTQSGTEIVNILKSRPMLSQHQAGTELYEKAEKFVIRFVKEIETKFRIYHSILEGEIEPKAGKISDGVSEKIGQILGSIHSEPVAVLLGAITEKVGTELGKWSYKEKVKRVQQLIHSSLGKGDFMEVLVRAGFEIVTNFEMMFTELASSENWRARMNKLAEDAANRAINYFIKEGVKELSQDIVTQGVIYGESKWDMLAGKSGFNISYRFSKNDSKKVKLKTAKLFSRSGIVVLDKDNSSCKYYLYRHANWISKFLNHGVWKSKYLYRLPFNWELREPQIFNDRLKENYVETVEPVREYDSKLKLQHTQEKIKNLLENINNDVKDFTVGWVNSIVDETKEELLKSVREIMENNKLETKDIELLRDIERIVNEMEIKESLENLERAFNIKNDELKNVVEAEGKLTRNVVVEESEKTRIMFRELSELVKGKLDISEDCRISNIRFEVLDHIPSFQGRKTELQALVNAVQQTDKLKENLYSRIVIVTGIGGVGKRELVRKFIKTVGNDYSNILWINAENFQSLKCSFYRIAYTMNVKCEESQRGEESIKCLVGILYSLLCEGDRKNLFVFDTAEKWRSQCENDEGIDKFLPLSLPPNCTKPDIIITSRKKGWDSQIKQIGLGPLKRDESFEVVKYLLPEEKTACAEKWIKDLAALLGDLPLALQQAAAYINYHEMEVKGYVEKFNTFENTVEMLNFGFPDDSINPYPRTVFTNWIMTLNKLKENKEGEIATNILNALAYMVPYCNTRSFVSMLGKEEEIRPGIRLLEKYNILTENFRIQMPVREVIRIHLKHSKEEEDVLRRLLELMNSRRNIVDLEQAEYVWNYAVEYESLIKTSMELKFPLVFCNDDELHLLHHSCIHGHINVVKYLVENEKVDWKSKQNSFGKTALHKAAEAGKMDIVKYLIERDVDHFDIKDSYGKTVLYRANQQVGNIEVILYLLEIYKKHERCEKQQWWWGFLLEAAKESDREVLRYLIEASYTLEPIHWNKTWLLHKAAEDGNLQVVEFLVKKGADVLYCVNGVTVLHVATYSGVTNVMSFVLDKAKETLDPTETKLYLNAKDAKEDTPLMWAAQGNKVEAIKFLLKCGADANIKNRDGKAAVDWAKEMQHEEAEKLLVNM